MKITFIDSPVNRGERVPERVFGCTYGRYPIPNIFLLYSASVLEEKGYDVKYVNCTAQGMNVTAFDDFLKNDRSDAYIFYSVNLSREIDRRSRSRIRLLRGPEVAIVSIGPAPTYYVSDFIDDEMTFVVRGEPELVLPELFSSLDDPSGISGVSILKNGSISNGSRSEPLLDLDGLPFPARHLLTEDFYFNPKFGGRKGKFTAMLTSRGCPYRCVYCVPNSLSFARELEFKKDMDRKPPYRARSSGNVIDEFSYLQHSGYSHISIIDDEFTIDRKRVLEICDGISGMGISWGCLARTDSIDSELAAAMVKAGCIYVDIGVESLEQEILDDIRKDINAESIKESVGLLKKAGIFTKLNILIGSSSLETGKTIRRTVDGAIALKPDSIMFSICNPFPGTEFYDIAMSNGFFDQGDYFPVDVQKRSTISLPGASSEYLERELRRANLKFFLSPRFILRNIWRLRSPGRFARAFAALWRKLF